MNIWSKLFLRAPSADGDNAVKGEVKPGSPTSIAASPRSLPPTPEPKSSVTHKLKCQSCDVNALSSCRSEQIEKSAPIARPTKSSATDFSISLTNNSTAPLTNDSSAHSHLTKLSRNSACVPINPNSEIRNASTLSNLNPSSDVVTAVDAPQAHSTSSASKNPRIFHTGNASSSVPQSSAPSFMTSKTTPPLPLTFPIKPNLKISDMVALQRSALSQLSLSVSTKTLVSSELITKRVGSLLLPSLSSQRGGIVAPVHHARALSTKKPSFYSHWRSPILPQARQNDSQMIGKSPVSAGALSHLIPGVVGADELGNRNYNRRRNMSFESARKPIATLPHLWKLSSVPASLQESICVPESQTDFTSGDAGSSHVASIRLNSSDAIHSIHPLKTSKPESKSFNISQSQGLSQLSVAMKSIAVAAPMHSTSSNYLPSTKSLASINFSSIGHSVNEKSLKEIAGGASMSFFSNSANAITASNSSLTSSAVTNSGHSIVNVKNVCCDTATPSMIDQQEKRAVGEEAGGNISASAPKFPKRMPPKHGLHSPLKDTRTRLSARFNSCSTLLSVDSTLHKASESPQKLEAAIYVFVYAMFSHMDTTYNLLVGVGVEELLKMDVADVSALMIHPSTAHRATLFKSSNILSERIYPLWRTHKSRAASRSPSFSNGQSSSSMRGIGDDLDHPERMPPPHFHAVHRFVRKLFEAAELPSEMAIIALFYVESLILNTGYMVHAVNVFRMCLGAILMACKIWDDHAVWNVDMKTIMPELELKDLNRLERWWLSKVQYKINVSRSMYARYWFEVRCVSDGVWRNVREDGMVKKSPSSMVRAHGGEVQVVVPLTELHVAQLELSSSHSQSMLRQRFSASLAQQTPGSSVDTVAHAGPHTNNRHSDIRGNSLLLLQNVNHQRATKVVDFGWGGSKIRRAKSDHLFRPSIPAASVL